MPYFSYTQIQLGSVTFYTWGLMVGLAFLAGYWLVLKKTEKKGISKDKIFWLAVLIFLSSILGARLGSVFLFKISGLMFYGGLFGALIVSWFYLKKYKIDFLEIADLLAPSIALGIFIGRLGCFLIKDHLGTVTNLPWAILWPDGIMRHPVALYLSLNGLLIFLILWFLQDKLKKPGQLFIIFLLWYSVARFLLDNGVGRDQLVAVQTDGVKVLADIPSVSANGMGKWRCNGSYPCLVASPNIVLMNDRRPQHYTFSQIVDDIKTHPRLSPVIQRVSCLQMFSLLLCLLID